MFIKGENAKRGTSKPELWILLWLGLESKQLIAKGFKPATVFKYKRQFAEVKKKVIENLTL